MHATIFLQDLAVVMITAGLVTVLFHRFKQPVVLGYILAGFLIGPHTPPFSFIHNEESIKTLAEIGVILLMFSLGLEFSLRKLRQVGGTAFIAAFLQIVLMVWVGYQVGRTFGWGTMDSIFLGAMLSISSTTIVVKTLAEMGKTREPFAALIFGILIIEDLLAIVMIALLSGIAMTGEFSVSELGMTVGKLGIFLVAALVVGFLAVPRLLGYVGRFKSNEMLLITVLGLCFGFSLLAVKLGYSAALGAFIIGAVVAESRELGRIEKLTEPVRDMFCAIFFVAIGLLIDPKVLAIHWLPILVISLAVLVGKILTCSFGTFVGGHSSRDSLRVGMGKAQIGEFSFIIASLGLSLKVTSGFLYPVAVAVSVITTLLTPYLIKSSDPLVNWFDRRAPNSLVKAMELYTEWVGRLASPSGKKSASKLIRRWSWQMALNSALIAAVFITSRYVSQHPPPWVEILGMSDEGTRAALWLTAVIVTLPLFIATFRKLQALGMLVAELTVTHEAAGEHTTAIRAVISHIIPTGGIIVLSVYILLLSSALLPPLRVLVPLLVVVALITWLLWRSFIKIYARAQISLQETLVQPPAPRHEEAHRPLPSILRKANLETIPLSPTSSAVGKLIRELQLRTLTGASIVGIERSGTSMINPGPDEELQAGDQVLLVGSRPQLDLARGALS